MGKLPTRQFKEDNAFQDSYAGYLFWTTDHTKPYFQYIFKYIEDAQLKVLQKNYPKYAQQILQVITDDPSSIFEIISTSSRETNNYANLPVLKYIKPKEFIDAWLCTPRDKWRTIKHAIDKRYENNKLRNILSEEKNWLIKLEDELNKKIHSSSNLDKFRLMRIRPEIFNKIHNENFKIEI